MSVSERVKKALKDNKFSLEDLAKKLGVTKQAVSKRLNSDRIDSTDFLKGVSSLTGVSFEYLLTGVDSRIEVKFGIYDDLKETILKILAHRERGDIDFPNPNADVLKRAYDALGNLQIPNRDLLIYLYGYDSNFDYLTPHSFLVPSFLNFMEEVTMLPKLYFLTGNKNPDTFYNNSGRFIFSSSLSKKEEEYQNKIKKLEREITDLEASRQTLKMINETNEKTIRLLEKLVERQDSTIESLQKELKELKSSNNII